MDCATTKSKILYFECKHDIRDYLNTVSFNPYQLYKDTKMTKVIMMNDQSMI